MLDCITIHNQIGLRSMCWWTSRTTYPIRHAPGTLNSIPAARLRYDQIQASTPDTPQSQEDGVSERRSLCTFAGNSTSRLTKPEPSRARILFPSVAIFEALTMPLRHHQHSQATVLVRDHLTIVWALCSLGPMLRKRSEERRVGKEWRDWG